MLFFQRAVIASTRKSARSFKVIIYHPIPVITSWMPNSSSAVSCCNCLTRLTCRRWMSFVSAADLCQHFCRFSGSSWGWLPHFMCMSGFISWHGSEILLQWKCHCMNHLNDFHWYGTIVKMSESHFPSSILIRIATLKLKAWNDDVLLQELDVSHIDWSSKEEE